MLLCSGNKKKNVEIDGICKKKKTRKKEKTSVSEMNLGKKKADHKLKISLAKAANREKRI